MALKIADDLDATGSTDPLVIKSGFVSVQGTWTGTIEVEVDPVGDGSWSPLSDSDGADLSYTANFNLAIDNGVPVKTRVTFTRSSGTAEVVLVGDTA